MRGQLGKTRKARSIGASACALLLCAAMMAALANTGANDAHADATNASEEVARTSTTDTKIVPMDKWYATGSNSKMDGTGERSPLKPGTGGYDTSGDLIPISGITLNGNLACIPAADYDKFLNDTSLAIYSEPDDTAGSDISWVRLAKVITIEVPDPVVTPTEPIRPLPDTGKDTTENGTDNTTKETEKAPDPPDPAPDKSTNNTSQTTDRTDRTPEETPILSLKCRQSESETKIAELESQGYEIIRVEKLPKWFY